MLLPDGVAAIFPYPANWTTSITESREYKTDIMRSRDGTEQRRAMRSKPRKSISFDVLLDGADAANFDYLMTALQPHIWMLPLWHRQRRLAAEATTGSDVLQFDSPLSHEARSGDYLILECNGKMLMQQIYAVAADRLSVTLVDELEVSLSAFTKIYPADRAQLRSSFNARRITSGVLQASLDFSCLVDGSGPHVLTTSPDMVLGAVEVLIRPINWVTSPELGYNWAPVIVDAELGPTAYETDGDLAVNTRQGEILTESRDEVDWWLAFFDRVRGRQVPFLMPTWFDLHLHEPVTPGATFEVPGIELGTYLPGNPVHTHLMVRLHDGSLAFYEIVFLTANPDEGVTVITTAKSWDQLYQPWTCLQACIVTVCRLASDILQINWITDEVAKITLAVQTIEDVA